MTNFVESDILLSPTFKDLPRFDSVVFKGFVAEKTQLFEASREGETFSVLAINIIRKDDKFIWESARDLFTMTIEQAGTIVRGVYRFELLTFDLHNEMKGFNPQDLIQLLANHSRKLVPGSQRLIKYSSVYGIFKKLVEEDWGKIQFQPAVEIFDKDPEKLDLLVKRLIVQAEKCPGRKFIVIHDWSLTKLFNPSNQEQQERLAKYTSPQASLFEQMPEVFFR